MDQIALSGPFPLQAAVAVVAARRTTLGPQAQAAVVVLLRPLVLRVQMRAAPVRKGRGSLAARALFPEVSAASRPAVVVVLERLVSSPVAIPHLPATAATGSLLARFPLTATPVGSAAAAAAVETHREAASVLVVRAVAAMARFRSTQARH